MTTGIVSRLALAHSLSSVMPSVSGIQMSSSTRSDDHSIERAWVFSSGRTLVAPVAQDPRAAPDSDFITDHQGFGA
jgi:hypothetical protein